MRWSRSGAAAAVLATAGFVWGCSGSPGERSGNAATLADTEDDSTAPEAATPEPAVSPAPSSDRATYHVPVPAELEPYSNFEIGDLRLREHGSEWELEYTLPELLVGSSERLSFRGSAADTGQVQLLGEAGQLSCHSLGALLQCDEVLSRVALDRDKLERSLAALPADESAARRAVAAHFSDDPIGVLTFPAQPR